MIDDLKNAAQNVIAVLLCIPVVVFGVFLLGRVMHPLPRKPALTARAVEIKPDALYGQPAGEASMPRPNLTQAQQIVYFAPTDATLPELVSTVEPAYSPEAISEGCSGPVQVRLMIDAQGRPDHPWIAHEFGCGLDQRALTAVSHWRFRPGTRNGKPVPIGAVVDVNFHR